MRARDQTNNVSQKASVPAPATALARAERNQTTVGKPLGTDRGPESQRRVTPRSGSVNPPLSRTGSVNPPLHHPGSVNPPQSLTSQTSSTSSTSTPSSERFTQHSQLPQRCPVHLPIVCSDRISRAKALVEKAVKQRKVFSIQGPYPVVRAALRARGWVEHRLPRNTTPRVRRQGDEGDDRDDSTDDEDSSEEVESDYPPNDIYELMSRLVRNETVYFYWTMRRDSVDYRSLRKDQITNHYAKAGSFTTKVGLCVNLRNLRWFDSADPDTFFPRCYRLGANDEKHAFIEDFRRTACSSLLQCLVERARGEHGQNEKEESADSSQAQKKRCKRRAIQSVDSGIIESALHVCQDFLDSLEHHDIDISMESPPALTEQQWREFLHNYYMVVHEGVGIQDSTQYLDRCQVMLRKLKEVSPQLDTDGIHNIWIVKPGALSRGRGIICMKYLEEILKLVNCDPTMIKDSKWVVQKYLERPLLIHGTKFDLRQWFLVTDWNPLTVWFYRECYLRFSTQPYSVERLDSSVHLCNNSIQKHFQPSQQRHPEVPEDNMWSSMQFRDFLSARGQAALWDNLVVPGMKEAVVHALQTAQDLVESRRASFELYGADFMLGQDLRPWLIEINGSPTMAPSTAVTAHLCTAVQEDTLRVVLDRRYQRSAYTGGFQLIYRQAAVQVPQYVGVNLFVEGAPLRRPRLRQRRKPALPRLKQNSQTCTNQSGKETTKREGEFKEKTGGKVGEKNGEKTGEKTGVKTGEKAKKSVKSHQSSCHNPLGGSKHCSTGKEKETHSEEEKKELETEPKPAELPKKGDTKQLVVSALKIIPECPVVTVEPLLKGSKLSKPGLTSEDTPHIPPRVISRSVDSSLGLCRAIISRSLLLPTLQCSSIPAGGSSLQKRPLDSCTTTSVEPSAVNTSLMQPLVPHIRKQSLSLYRGSIDRKSL